MVGDGVEATGKGDEFTCVAHALEHFASSLVVIAGSVEDGVDGLRGGAVVQEAQDGLAVWRTDGSGGQAFKGGAVAFAEPVEGGNVGVGGNDFVAKDARGCTQGMFGGQQQVVAVVAGIDSEQQATADGFQQRRSGSGCV